MCKQYFLLNLLFLFSLAGFTQDAPYPLHPSVGDTIDIDEKLDYSLFPELSNNHFDFATILYKNEGFVLRVIEFDVDNETGLEVETNYEIELTQDKIIESQRNIEKINAYYRYLANDSNETNIKSDVVKSNSGIPSKLENSDKMSEHLKKQFRMDQRLREDNQRMQEVEMGLRPREVRIEFR